MKQLEINHDGHSLLPVSSVEEHDKRFAVEFIANNPGVTHRQLLAHLNNIRAIPLTLDQVRWIVDHLEQKGVLGLQIIRSPKNFSLCVFFGERINLEVHWLKASGRAKGDHRYPWLCLGKKPIKYIGGGDSKSPTAQARVELVENWIREGLSQHEIIELIPKLQQNLKKAKKKPKD